METTTGAQADAEGVIKEPTAVSQRLSRLIQAPTGQPARPQPPEDARLSPDLMEALGVAVYITDANGVIMSYNTAAADLWGREPVVGKDLWCGSWKIYHLDGITIMPHDDCPMAVCLKEDRPIRGVEAIAERPDGSRVFFRPFPTPLHDDAGMLIGAVNVLVDVTEGKRAELDAVRLAAIVESSDDAIVSKDLNGIVSSWNPSAERIFGYTAEEMIGQSIRRIIPHDRQEEEDQVLSRIREGERVDHFETIRRRKDGTEFPISLTVSPVRDRAGRIIGASKVVRDVSERRQADQALRESEERLRLAQSIARVGTFEWNIQSGLNVWTPDLEAIYGLKTGEFARTQQAWADLVHPDDRAAALEKVDHAIQTGLPTEHEWRVVWPDGATHWVAGRFQCVHDSQGKPLLLSGVNIDITERKLAEEALRESEESLREERDNLETINRIATMLSAELDVDRLVQSLTDQATRLVGADFGAFFYNVVDARGESYMLYTVSGAPREAFDKFPMPRNTALFAPTFSGEGIVRLDDVRKDPRYGKSAPFHGMPPGHLPVTSYLAVPVVSRSGQVLGGLFFGHSQATVFTERHEKILQGVAGQTAIAIENARLFDQLQKSMAVKDQFLGLVSHELRTPITTILGNSLLLLRRHGKLPADTRKQALRDVADEAERLQRIIENLLLLTRVDVAEHVDVEPIRLQSLIAQAVDVFQRRNTGRPLSIKSDDDIPIVVGQPGFLSLVLDNLITNADKYSPTEAPIEILVHINNHQDVEVCVRDYGIGLDADDIKQIFTPFYRSARARSQAKGIGLGLAVCKRVMEAQGGEIRAVARPDGGCDFAFTLKRYRDEQG